MEQSARLIDTLSGAFRGLAEVANGQLTGHNTGDNTMWKTKCFKSRELGQQWISSHAVQWEEIFVNNTAFAITYRPLRVIG